MQVRDPAEPPSTDYCMQAAMNALHPLAVYAAVQAHKNEPLHYPGDIEAW